MHVNLQAVINSDFISTHLHMFWFADIYVQNYSKFFFELVEKISTYSSYLRSLIYKEVTFIITNTSLNIPASLSIGDKSFL